MANWEGKPTLASVLKGYTPPTESPLADPIKEHFRTLPQQLATNQAALDSAINSWNKTDFATGKPNPNYRPEAIAELTQLMPNIGGLTAWHGTPHKIAGKFDISKVGTGEGAQAYGHGMYFAENPNVAKGYVSAAPYKGNLAKELPEQAWEELGPIMQKHNIPGDMPIGKDETTALKEMLFEYGNKLKPEEKAVFEKWGGSAGNLYKVDIPDEYIPNMLDWDKPLSQQPKAVQNWLKDPYNFYREKLIAKDSGGNEPTGNLIYNRLQELMSEGKKSDVFANQANFGALNASKELADFGIPGIRYLDENSRNAGKGTSNFVVFDPSTVKILEENNKPVSRKEILEEQVKKLKD